MLPVKRESHLHYQGRSCKGKYFALHGEREALESSDLESNLGSWLLGSWASVTARRPRPGGREKQVPFDCAQGRLSEASLLGMTIA